MNNAPAKSHVLLVEDNPSDSSLLEELLEEGSYQVALYCTNNGYDAFDFLNRQDKYRSSPKPDAILLDLGLPRMNGYEVLARIRKTPHFSHIPVIVLTTSRDPKDRELCMTLGAQEFLSKPYNLEGYEVLVDHLASVVLPGIFRKSAGMH
jgi:CheY-like chemotaxis protein